MITPAMAPKILETGLRKRNVQFFCDVYEVDSDAGCPGEDYARQSACHPQHFATVEGITIHLERGGSFHGVSMSDTFGTWEGERGGRKVYLTKRGVLRKPTTEVSGKMMEVPNSNHLVVLSYWKEGGCYYCCCYICSRGCVMFERREDQDEQGLRVEHVSVAVCTLVWRLNRRGLEPWRADEVGRGDH